MTDHDQLFKTLIQTFFGDFLRAFLPVWNERLDAASVEWLEQEAFNDPPSGDRRVFDLVGKLQARIPAPGWHEGDPSGWLALVHVEIESPERTTTFRERLPVDYNHLRRRYGLPVLPIAVFLKVGLDGVGIETVEDWFYDFKVAEYNAFHIGLPGLDGEAFLHGDNWLGVALSVLMKMPRDRIARNAAEAFRRIVGAPLDDFRRHMLASCISTYVPEEAGLRGEAGSIIDRNADREVQTMKNMFEERGEIRGLIKGEIKGQRQFLLQALQTRFGPLEKALQTRIETLDDKDRLNSAFQLALTANTLEEIAKTI